MNLNFKVTSVGGIDAVQICDESGRCAGYITATAEGIHISSDWIAAVKHMDTFEPQQVDVHLSRVMKHQQLQDWLRRAS